MDGGPEAYGFIFGQEGHGVSRQGQKDHDRLGVQDALHGCMTMESIRFVRYRTDHFEPMRELHRDAKDALTEIGLTVGISDHDEEVDLREIEQVYINDGGEFLIGLLDGVVIAMGGFQRLSEDSAELRRMRIRGDLQDQGYGSQLLQELERAAFRFGIRTLSFETAKARPLTLEFYRKHGYQETGSGLYGEVETVHFRKVLNERDLIPGAPS